MGANKFSIKAPPRNQQKTLFRLIKIICNRQDDLKGGGNLQRIYTLFRGICNITWSIFGVIWNNIIGTYIVVFSINDALLVYLFEITTF